MADPNDNLITPDDLAIPLSSDLTDNPQLRSVFDEDKQTYVPSKPLKWIDADRILKSRLKEFDPDAGGAGIIAELIRKSIPEDLWYQGILESVDLRPYLTKISQAGPDAKYKMEDGIGGTVNNMPAQADKFLAKAQGQVADLVKGQGGTAATPPPIDTTKAGVAPETRYVAELNNPASTQESVIEATTSNDDFGAGLAAAAGGGTGTLTPWSRKDALTVFRATGQDFGYLVQAEEQARADYQQVGADPSGISIEMQMDPNLNLGSIEYNEPYLQERKMTAIESLDLIYQMTEEELHTMEKNLRKAGYYDRIGKAPSGTGFTDDDANYAAWKLLLGDAARGNTSITQMLAIKEQQYKQEQAVTGVQPFFDDIGRPIVDDQGNKLVYGDNGIPSVVPKEEALQLTDPNAIRWDADGQAAKLLDRYLTPTELDYIVEQVHGAERNYERESRKAKETGSEYTALDTAAITDTLIKSWMPIEGQDHPLTPDEMKMKFLARPMHQEDSAPPTPAARPYHPRPAITPVSRPAQQVPI